MAFRGFQFKDRQQAIRMGMRIAFGVWVVCVVTYFAFFAADRFVSVAQFRVARGTESASRSVSGGLATALGISPDRQDAFLAINYIRSADMMKLLDEEFDLRQHYRVGPRNDLLFRMWGNAYFEDFLRYYQDRVHTGFDQIQGIVTVEVEAFAPETAQKHAQALLRHTEDFLNDQNRLIAKRRMEFVSEEVAQNEKQVQEAKEALLRFQNEHSIVDPAVELTAGFGLIQELKKQRAFTRAELLPLQQSSPDSPRLQELRALVDVFDQEILSERNRLTGQSKEPLNQVLAGFEEIKRRLEFAEDRYKQNLILSEDARLQSIQDHRFFTLVASPQLPDKALRPRRFYLVASFILLGGVVLQVVRVVGLTIADHGS